MLTMKHPEIVKKADDLTPLVNVYLLAHTHAECEREKVDRIQRAILESGNYHDDQGNRITEPKRAWMIINDDIAHEYFSAIRRALEAEGYKITALQDSKGDWDYFCPALVAEKQVLNIEHALIVSAAAMLDCGPEFFDKLIRAGTDKYRYFIDTIVKFVVNSPNYTRPRL